jgi:hypothetical protein
MRISICHCLACQRRTGSAFGVQAAFAPDQVRVTGRYSDYARTSDEEDRKVHVFHFCPDCGATVFHSEPTEPDVLAVPVGAFADPAFPPPTTSIYESRRHPWVGLPPEVETDELWESLRPLYEAGEYAEVADRGRELLATHPAYAQLMYNVACCESLAGRTGDAIEHLRRAIERAPDLRGLAAGDSDLDPIRAEPAFTELMS